MSVHRFNRVMSAVITEKFRRFILDQFLVLSLFGSYVCLLIHTSIIQPNIGLGLSGEYEFVLF